MKELNGRDLAGFIKERQAKEARRLRQAKKITPHLAIIRANDDSATNVYLKIKQTYGQDIGVTVSTYEFTESDGLESKIADLNKDPLVSGIIIQLPLRMPELTDKILQQVKREKDVDGLTSNSPFDPPAAIAIQWLLAGYDIELAGKNIVIIGRGRLVGAPLTKLWQKSGLTVTTADDTTKNLKELTLSADILVTGTGAPGLVTSEMVKQGAVVIDAGSSKGANGSVGDVDAKLRRRTDITITPEKGGVGPLTVAALFENVLAAARNSKGN